jgi:hypothetical protein
MRRSGRLSAVAADAARDLDDLTGLPLLRIRPCLCRSILMNDRLTLNDRGYFETRGLNVLAFSNWYDGLFSDAKISGIELIHHEVRTATNGDVRLSATPGQWDLTPTLVDRRVDAAAGLIEARLAYPDHGLQYTIRVEAHETGVRLSVDLDAPLPPELEGRAGFNLEFLPAAYFGKAYLIDGRSGLFPRYPSGPTARSDQASAEPQPFARGRTITLAPEDPERRVTITAGDGELLLFDGRNTAQNGWFVVRSLLPGGRSGRVGAWSLTASTIDGWLRPPVIAHSQIGYHPDQRKVAVIELDPHAPLETHARVLRITSDGRQIECYRGPTARWGGYLRYAYATFDFSSVREHGLYMLAYADTQTHVFQIAPHVYETAWHPTLDIFFPVQMDHMFVREAYRVWHGAPHLDDARQAPVNHEHFDLYAQGPTTDTPYAPGEHIPGLNVGGWFDAGDFDIRTQTQYATILDLVHTWEAFRIERDETTVDQTRRSVTMHAPDGAPDLLQQIEHGTLALIAQHRAVGHAIPGIVEPDLVQYAHLGDASTKTDNLVHNPALGPGETDGFSSGTADDRWAFTSRSSALNYGSIAALAAASRALRGYRDELAVECFATAARVWDEEHAHAPDIFAHGNTTGGQLETEELRAALELLICTGDARYGRRIDELWPAIEQRFEAHADIAVRAMPYMDEAYARRLQDRTMRYSQQIAALAEENPFGTPISTGGWAGNGWIIRFAITNYLLHRAFPQLIDAEAVFRGLHYLYGCHPGSDISFVSGVGTVSKEVAYGNNRADFSFIAGGVVPGVLVLKPDFPENKEDWPFLWGQNEYVVDVAAAYLFLVNAVNQLVHAVG